MSKPHKAFKITTWIRGCNSYARWRFNVVERDNWTCRDCDEIAVPPEAHHIVGLFKIVKDYKITTPEEAGKCKILWDIDNGVTLCDKCHKKRHQGIKLTWKQIGNLFTFMKKKI